MLYKKIGQYIVSIFCKHNKITSVSFLLIFQCTKKYNYYILLLYVNVISNLRVLLRKMCFYVISVNSNIRLKMKGDYNKETKHICR